MVVTLSGACGGTSGVEVSWNDVVVSRNGVVVSSNGVAVCMCLVSKLFRVSFWIFLLSIKNKLLLSPTTESVMYYRRTECDVPPQY